MAPRTRKSADQHMADMNYLLDKILDLEDPNDPIRGAITRANITTVKNLLAIEIHSYESLKYTAQNKDDTSTITNLPDHSIGTLKSFKRYVAYLQQIGAPIKNQDWQSIDPDDFDNFRIGPYNQDNPPRITSPNPAHHIDHPPKTVDKIKEFRKGMRRDPAVFTDLKRDEDFRAWNNNTVIQAAAQGVENVLDSSYNPTDDVEKALFAEQQKYMISVFSTKLHNTKGKELVRKYTPSKDAQKIYAALSQHCNKSTKSEAECARISDFLLNARLENWSGSAFDFIAHMRNQVQVYNEKSKIKYSDDQEQQYLEQAVQNVPDLANIKKTSKLLEISTGKSVSLDEYTTLLNEAAMDYDLKVGTVSARVRRQPRQQRQTYLHEFPTEESLPYSAQAHDFHSMYSADYHHHYDDVPTLDLDASIWEIHQQMQWFPSRPRLPGTVWHDLDNADQKAWDTLKDAGKSSIIHGLRPGSGPNSHSIDNRLKIPPGRSPPPKSTKTPSLPGKTHKIRFADMDPSDLHAELLAFEAFREGRLSASTETFQMQKHQQTSDDEYASAEEISDVHNDGDLYAHMTKNQNNKAATPQKPLPGNVNRLLSKRSGKNHGE